jgi:anti-sigma-K factor RskA
MSENYDLPVIAGEYVLGTLDPLERAFVEKERNRNVDLEAEIEFWEARLFPLTDHMPSVDPPLQLWNRVEPLIVAAPRSVPPVKQAPLPLVISSPQVPELPVQSKVAPSQNDGRGMVLWLWRAYSVLASLIAVIALYYIYSVSAVSHDAPSLWSFLQSESSSAGFTVTVDNSGQTLNVTLVRGMALPKDKNYQLWLIADDQAQPRSLGVITSTKTSLHPDAESYNVAQLRHATFAISVEPLGGSVTGLPTGPVIATGRATNS